MLSNNERGNGSNHQRMHHWENARLVGNAFPSQLVLEQMGPPQFMRHSHRTRISTKIGQEQPHPSQEEQSWKPRCFHCGGPHTTNMCTKGTPEKRCFTCQKMGHFARDCPNKNRMTPSSIFTNLE
ncbi:hypothetical protein ACSQ67_025843 [Phaseolus vulgaris]